MASVTAIGNKRILDEDGKLRKSRWYFEMEDSDDSDKDSDDEEN